MKRSVLSVLLVSSVVGLAVADPFSNVAAHGYAETNLTSLTTYFSGGGLMSDDHTGNQSLIATVTDSSHLDDTWSDNGVNQHEIANSDGSSFGSCTRTGLSLGTEVSAISSFSFSSTGNSAFSYASSSAAAVTDVTFTVTSPTPVFISNSVKFGTGYIALLKDGNLFIDTDSFSGGSFYAVLAPGDYGIYASAFSDGTTNGGANLNIQSVPEPTSFAAFGIGAVGLLVRRKRSHR